MIAGVGTPLPARPLDGPNLFDVKESGITHAGVRGTVRARVRPLFGARISLFNIDSGRSMFARRSKLHEVAVRLQFFDRKKQFSVPTTLFTCVFTACFRSIME